MPSTGHFLDDFRECTALVFGTTDLRNLIHWEGYPKTRGHGVSGVFSEAPPEGHGCLLFCHDSAKAAGNGRRLVAKHTQLIPSSRATSSICCWVRKAPHVSPYGDVRNMLVGGVVVSKPTLYA